MKMKYMRLAEANWNPAARKKGRSIEMNCIIYPESIGAPAAVNLLTTATIPAADAFLLLFMTPIRKDCLRGTSIIEKRDMNPRM